jgi:hypothetical protein
VGSAVESTENLHTNDIGLSGNTFEFGAVAGSNRRYVCAMITAVNVFRAVLTGRPIVFLLSPARADLLGAVTRMVRGITTPGNDTALLQHPSVATAGIQNSNALASPP